MGKRLLKEETDEGVEAVKDVVMGVLPGRPQELLTDGPLPWEVCTLSCTVRWQAQWWDEPGLLVGRTSSQPHGHSDGERGGPSFSRYESSP